MQTFVTEMKFLFNLYDKSKGQEEVEHLTRLFTYLITHRDIVNDLEEFKLNMMMRARELYDEVDQVSYEMDENVKSEFKKTLKNFILIGCTGL